jgi:hypothetical protein
VANTVIGDALWRSGVRVPLPDRADFVRLGERLALRVERPRIAYLKWLARILVGLFVLVGILPLGFDTHTAGAATSKASDTAHCLTVLIHHLNVTKSTISECNASSLRVTHLCPKGSSTIFVLRNRRTYVLRVDQKPITLAKQYGMGTITEACGYTTSGSNGLDLDVVPMTNLHNGEVVVVSVSGFPPGKAFLSECASATDVNVIGCGAQLAAQPFVEIEGGGGTERFTVNDHAASAPLTSQPGAVCTTQCVLVATSGENPAGLEHVATVSLAFES